MQRTELSQISSGETLENPSQESHHSTWSLSAAGSSHGSNLNLSEEGRAKNAQPDPNRKERIEWPKMCEELKWRDLDYDLSTIVEITLQGNLERKMESYSTIIYNMCKERFGVRKKEAQKTQKTDNRREKQIKTWRKEVKDLTKRFRTAHEEEKAGLADLTSEIREKIRRARRAEQIRKQKKQRGRKRSQFIQDPFKFTKTLLGGEKSGKLMSSKEEVETHLRETHSDSRRGLPLGECDKIMPEQLPSIPMNEKEPSLREVQEVVKKARASSAPGPSGIPYKVYKKCPTLTRKLWQLLRKVWHKGNIPNGWKRAEGCFVPKEKDSEKIKQFRNISLLSVEGKVFFSIMAKRMTEYMISNKYIDVSIQKGGIPGFSGCIEHTSVISQLIRETKERRGDLTCVWLDLANAYGSIPHQLIDTAMKHYHIPDHFRNLVNSYFQGIKLRFTFRDVTTDWQDLEKGIITGCTISPILFIMGMNIIIKAAERETRGPRLTSGVYSPANRGFMDDLTITTTSHVQARWVLTALEEVVTWARMEFKPKKSRSMVIKKGKITDRFKLKVQGEEIPSILSNPIKCLGKWYDETLGDTANKRKTEVQLMEWLNKIEKSGLPGKYKAWIYQHGLLPRVMWMLTLYEIPMSTVEAMERKISGHLRRWLGIPPSFTSVGLYSRSAELQLPLSSIAEEFKVAKCRLVMTLRDSKDSRISEAGVQTRTGRKWSANKEVRQAEDMLAIRDIIGNTCIGRQGLGLSKFNQWSSATGKERRDMVLSEVRKVEEDNRRAKSVELGQQGAWTRWNLPERKLTWSDIWKMEPLRIRFLLRSVYDVLPSPTNLSRWGLIDDPRCKLCGEKGTMAHILSGCKTALQQGRYRWRHDKVLQVLADILDKEIKKPRGPKHRSHYITFVRQGEKARSPSHRTSSILDGTRWQMKVDLNSKLVFPEIVQTNLRPDIVIWSSEQKSIVVIELTVPWEEGCEEAHERKSAKYEELMEMCRDRGWKTWLFPVEVGCRGFPAQSVWKTFSLLGIQGKERRTAIRRLQEQAEKSSCWLWYRREETSWKPSIDTQ